MSDAYVPDMSDFNVIGYAIADAAVKTAASKAGEAPYLDAYLAGFQDSFGVTDTGFSKVACNVLGREIMGDFVPRMMLNK